ERLAIPRRTLVNELRDDLLAGPGLARDQHGGLRRRDAPDRSQDLPPRARAAHDAAPAAHLELAGQCLDRRLESLGALAPLGGNASILGEAVDRERQRVAVGAPARHLGVLLIETARLAMEETEPALDLAPGEPHRHAQPRPQTRGENEALALRARREVVGDV